ncbi:MAG: hypothetical protein WCA07_01855 [Gloeobacterales cyanobacterium]
MHSLKLYLQGSHRAIKVVGYTPLLISLSLILLINLVCWALWQPILIAIFGQFQGFCLTWILCAVLYILGTQIRDSSYLIWQGCLLGSLWHLIDKSCQPFLGFWANLLGLIVTAGLVWWFFFKGNDRGDGGLPSSAPIPQTPSPVLVR